MVSLAGYTGDTCRQHCHTRCGCIKQKYKANNQHHSQNSSDRDGTENLRQVHTSQGRYHLN